MILPGWDSSNTSRRSKRGVEVAEFVFLISFRTRDAEAANAKQNNEPFHTSILIVFF